MLWERGYFTNIKEFKVCDQSSWLFSLQCSFIFGLINVGVSGMNRSDNQLSSPVGLTAHINARKTHHINCKYKIVLLMTKL